MRTSSTRSCKMYGFSSAARAGNAMKARASNRDIRKSAIRHGKESCTANSFVSMPNGGFRPEMQFAAHNVPDRAPETSGVVFRFHVARSLPINLQLFFRVAAGYPRG